VWVNVAFTSVFAPFAEIGPAEYKRVTEVSYLGYVYGTMAALKRMLPRGRRHDCPGSAPRWPTGGSRCRARIAGAKHAIQGFNESLRCELLHDKSNVRVTMVQMPAVNTPQFRLGVVPAAQGRPQPVPPIYQPEVGGPTGSCMPPIIPSGVSIGSAGSTAATLAANAVAPGLLDRYPGPHWVFPHSRTTGLSPRPTPVNLWKPADGPSGHDYTPRTGSFDGPGQAAQRPAVGLSAPWPAGWRPPGAGPEPRSRRPFGRRGHR